MRGQIAQLLSSKLIAPLSKSTAYHTVFNTAVMNGGACVTSEISSGYLITFLFSLPITIIVSIIIFDLKRIFSRYVPEVQFSVYSSPPIEPEDDRNDPSQEAQVL